ncbi:MAG: TolC family protein [Ignavibacteriae bacterium]|nr:TolC family protein [Ignavibacteriota bacterium]
MKRYIPFVGWLSLFLFMQLQGQEVKKLSLHDALEFALKNNPNLLKAEKEIDAANGRILQSGKIPNPEFSIAVNETPSGINFGSSNEQDISLSQEIEYPTKRNWRIDIAVTEKQLTQLELARTKILLTGEVKQAYYHAYFAKKQIDFLQQQLVLLDDVQTTLTSQYQTNNINYLDIIRMKVERTRLSNDINEARREYRVRLNALTILIGYQSDENVEVSDSIAFMPVKLQQDSLVTSLMGQSITLNIAKQSIQREQQSLSLAKTSYLPDFSVGISHQRRRELNGFNNNLWGIELKASLPFWSWYEPKGQVEEATARTSIAEENLKAVERNIRTRIKNSFDFVQTTEQQIRSFDESLLRDAKDILSIAITQYQNNQIDILNVLDIYRTYLSTNIEYARALLNYAIALAELETSAELPNEQQF